MRDFLLARIAEDEAVARAAEPLVTGMRVTVWTCDKYGHVAVDPARVLAECEAKRRIVEACSVAVPQYGAPAHEWARVPGDRDDVLRHLAAVYAAHPAYQDEWRP